MWQSRESPLLDRDDELTTLDAALRRSVRGRGSVIIVEGAAGTGKSALIAAGRDLATAAGVRVLGARGGELEHDYPFGIARQLFEPIVAGAGDDRRARLLAGAAAPATWVLGLSDGGSGVYASGFAAMNALYWLAVALADEQPLCLLVDDAHWADVSSLRALDYLARRVTELPVALVVALRPDEPAAAARLLDELRTAPEAIRVPLRPLGPEAVARIVREWVASADAEACAAAHEITAGNPFYVVELLRALRSGGQAVDAGEVLRASVPSLGDRVIRRAAQVGEEGPALTRSMAILGDGARLATAAELAAVAPASAARIAHALRRIEVLAAEDPIAFVHPLVRRSVYDAMSEPERHAGHRQAAQLLRRSGAPEEVIAAHLLTLRPSGDSAVASMLMAAADRALEKAAPDEAVDWLERALAEEAAEPPRVQLLAQLATAMTVQRNPAAIGRLREAYELAREPPLRARLAATLAEVLTHAGLWDDAIAVIESVEGELAGAGPELETEIAALRAAVSLFDPARIHEFDERREHYVRLAHGDYWASHAISALLAVEAIRRGRVEEAVAFCEQALVNGRLIAQRGAGAWTAPQVIGTLIEAEEIDRAVAAIDAVAAAARSSGAVFAVFTSIAFRGLVSARRGELAAAEADLTTVLRLANEAGMVMGVTTAAFFLEDVLLERDSLAEVEALLENVQLGPDFLRTMSGAMLLEVRGRLRLLRREREAGIADLRAAGRTLSTLRFGPSCSSWRSWIALALGPADRDEALALATEELELARAAGLTGATAVALRTLGVLTDGAAGIDLLQESTAVLAGSQARLEHARSLVELGSALRRANRRAEARPLLARGLELAGACGAQRLAARAQDELRAAGGRRTRIASSGRDALTASELRVVRLAAGGATNTEIAQELYVTLKTVETHLSRAYAKLGLAGSGSRARLTGALGEA